MTPQERDLLTRFLDDLAHAQPAAKDGEAAAQIDRALSTNRDAGYVLVQHAIVSDAALHDARQQVEALQQQLDDLQRRLPAAVAPPAPPEPSFLGSLFGRGRPSDAPGAGGAWSGPGSAVPATSPYGSGGYPQPGGGPFSGGGGLGSFMRTAGATAAGVAGGAFLFEGLSDMFGGGEHRQDMFEGGDRQGFADMGGGGGQDAGQFDVGGGDPGGGDYS